MARDGRAKISLMSQRLSRSDFNCLARIWTASRLTELRDTPPSAPSPEELPQCLNEAILRAFPRPRGLRLPGTNPLHGSSPIRTEVWRAVRRREFSEFARDPAEALATGLKPS